MELPDARRSLYKATYAPIALDKGDARTGTQLSRGVDKAITVRAMELRPEEITALRSAPGQQLGQGLLDVLTSDVAGSGQTNSVQLARHLQADATRAIAALGR